MPQRPEKLFWVGVFCHGSVGLPETRILFSSAQGKTLWLRDVVTARSPRVLNRTPWVIRKLCLVGKGYKIQDLTQRFRRICKCGITRYITNSTKHCRVCSTSKFCRASTEQYLCLQGIHRVLFGWWMLSECLADIARSVDAQQHIRPSVKFYLCFYYFARKII